MPKYWLVTWTTYGWWLPGDRRGFQTRRGKEYIPPPARYAKPGEPIYDPAPYKERFKQMKQLVPDAVVLTREEQYNSLAAIVAEIEVLQMVPRIMALAPTHAHLIAQFGLGSAHQQVSGFRAIHGACRARRRRKSDTC